MESSTDGSSGSNPVILHLESPRPAVVGSLIEVRGLGLSSLDIAPQLELRDGERVIDTLELIRDASDSASYFYAVSATMLSTLGEGFHRLDARVRGAGGESEPYSSEFELANRLILSLREVPSGQVHHNEALVVQGGGLLAPTEGLTQARFVGTFTTVDGEASEVDVALPVALVERISRDRGLVVLTTDIGGLAEGSFDGTVELENRLVAGDMSTSEPISLSLYFNPPALYSLDPIEASVGRILNVSGAGFLGGAERSDETTLLRLQGTFTPEGGESMPFETQELVPRFVSGGQVELEVEPEVQGEQIVAVLFGYQRGVFQGRATPITVRGLTELEGSPVDVGFVLGPVTQVVYVSFLPGYYDSLARFGLSNAALNITSRVVERMQSIYAEWNVDIRNIRPTDYSRNAYAVVEIGGPDPNGVGLFGYDNTPGKDVGNLRLFDAIGGINAETQDDGFPGYGGVFIESFLYWSEHPELGGTERPAGAPDADEDGLFDEVFDPVRMVPATLAEANGLGAEVRIAQVERAVRALSSLIGETAAHELGHSLGLAQPRGPSTVFHNDFDDPGCLMDSGSNRPLGERMAEPGFEPTHFCYDAPIYLSEILAR